MANTNELSKRDINILFESMDKELSSRGFEFTFIQLRMSAERFVVPVCGLSIERALVSSKSKYHIYFEKKLPQFKQGPVDLVLVPINIDGVEDWNAPYCFEFKMVWMNGIKSNLEGMKHDFGKLNGYFHGFIVALLFSFDRTPDWAPYAHKGDMKQLAERVIANIGTPVFEGQEHIIANHEAEGKIKLVAWIADMKRGVD